MRDKENTKNFGLSELRSFGAESLIKNPQVCYNCGPDPKKNMAPTLELRISKKYQVIKQNGQRKNIAPPSRKKHMLKCAMSAIPQTGKKRHKEATAWTKAVSDDQRWMRGSAVAWVAPPLDPA